MSIVKFGTIQNGAGVQVYPAKAWVSFNGTGTIAIRASGNASSLTDTNIGSYSVNFATAITDVNYSYGHSYSNDVSTQHTIGFWGGQATTSCAVVHYNAQNSANVIDKSFVLMVVHR